MTARLPPRSAALALAILLAGCAMRDAPMTTLAPKSDLAQWIQSLLIEVTIWDTIIFAIVMIGVLLALFVFSTRVGEAAPAASAASDLRLEAAWTLGPALVVLFISIPTVRTIFRSQPRVAPADALEVQVVAHQWWWEFDYPQFGLTTANELHLPVNRPIRFALHSGDVIHSFWVPALGGKRDVVPGQNNEITLIANTEGRYLGQCAEFCGLSHANMRFRVFVESKAGFDHWKGQQLANAIAPPADTPESAGADEFAGSPCTTCHTITGVSQGHIGPDLTHFASRTTLAAGVLDNTSGNLAHWLINPEHVKPGAEMPALGLSGDRLDNLVAYLESLK